MLSAVRAVLGASSLAAGSLPAAVEAGWSAYGFRRQLLMASRAAMLRGGAGEAAAGSRSMADDAHVRPHGTTVLCVRRDNEVVVMADGQVTLGSMVVKHNVKKVRRITEDVIGGFAGAAADGITLFERLETQLEEHPGQLMRACVELAKAWRTDRYLRRLDASLVVADRDRSFEITGAGDVLEASDVSAIGSGSPYAAAAARALMGIEGLDALTIAKRSMEIAAESCIYTNSNFSYETIATPAGPVDAAQDPEDS